MDDNVNSESNRCAQIDVPPLGAPLLDNVDDNDSPDSGIDYLALAGPPPPLSPKFRNVAIDDWLANCTECNVLTGPPLSSPPWPSSPPASAPPPSSPPPSDTSGDDDTADNSIDLSLILKHHEQHDPAPHHPTSRRAPTESEINLLNQIETKSRCDILFVDFQYCTGSSTAFSFDLGRLDGVLLGHWHVEFDETAVQHQLARIDENKLHRFNNAQFVYCSTTGHACKGLSRMFELWDTWKMKWWNFQPPVITPMGNHEPAPPNIVSIDDDEPALRDVWILSDGNSIRQLEHLSLLHESLDPIPQHLKHLRKEDEPFLRHQSLRDIVEALLPITSTKLDPVYTLLISDPVHLQRELQPHRAMVAVEMISQVIRTLICR